MRHIRVVCLAETETNVHLDLINTHYTTLLCKATLPTSFIVTDKTIPLMEEYTDDDEQLEYVVYKFWSECQ